MSQNQLALTQQRLSEAPSVRAVLDLPEVQANWVKTYQQVSGRHDGPQRFEAEKILFLQATSANGFKNVERFSLYSCFIELAISGLTLRDGIAYVVPYNKTASFIPGWKGRLEQINEMPDVTYTHEPQVVKEGDEFEFELGMSPKIHKHKPLAGNTGEITYVYFVVEFTYGPRVYIMSRAECINIRNRFSQSFKTYLSECQRAEKEIGETFTVVKNYNGNSWEQIVEPPMWISDEAQAFKKTIVKRTYNNLPKLPKHKHLDARTAEVMGENFNQHADLEEFANYSTLPEGAAGNGGGSGNGNGNNENAF